MNKHKMLKFMFATQIIIALEQFFTMLDQFKRLKFMVYQLLKTTFLNGTK